MRDDIKNFMTLFSGNTDAHGVHIPDKVTVAGNKAPGRSTTERTPPSEGHFELHIKGEQGLGIIPIDKNGKVRFGAIDIDRYEQFDEKRWCRLIYENELPLTPFRSKSGGMHLFVFFSKPTNAEKVVQYLSFVRYLLCLSDKTEVFPKQKVLVASQTGNWINLPYFNAEETTRYMYDAAGNKLPFAQAMLFAMDRRINIDDAIADLERMHFAKGPPCIQRLFLNRDTELRSNRNKALFNIATYFKAVDENTYIDRTIACNRLFPEPLSDTEVQRTVISSHERNTYPYQCNEEPLSDHCNREVCMSRPYGFSQGSIANVAVGQLTRHGTKDPYYIWEINGEPVQFKSERELMSQSIFRAMMIRYANKVPAPVKPAIWDSVVQRALNSMVTIEDETADDMTTDTSVKTHLARFIKDRQVVSFDDVADGFTYIDVEKDKALFKVSFFLEYLFEKRALTAVDNKDIRKGLHALGVKKEQRKCSSGKYMRVHAIAMEALYGDEKEDVLATVTHTEKEAPMEKAIPKNRLEDALKRNKTLKELEGLEAEMAASYVDVEPEQTEEEKF